MASYNKDKLFRGKLAPTLKDMVQFEDCFKYTPHPYILGMMNGHNRKSFADLGVPQSP